MEICILLQKYLKDKQHPGKDMTVLVIHYRRVFKVEHNRKAKTLQ